MKSKRLLTLAIVAAFMLTIVPAGATAVDSSSTEQTKQYVIVTENAAAAEKALNEAEVTEVTQSQNNTIPDIVVAEITPSQAEEIEDMGSTVSVEEDIILSGSMEETAAADEVNQWYLDAIGLTEADEPANKVKVALIDSGIYYTDDIDVANSINLVDGDGEVNPLFLDASGHGTAMASIIAANGSDGISGINPNVELYSAKVLDSENQALLSDVIESIYWAIQNDVDIINMSFGTEVNSEALHSAVKAAENEDVLMIAAAGNTQHSAVQYPAAYNEVVAVGSTDATGDIAQLTSIGTQLELLAPGEKIAASDFLGYTTVASGTSLATAQVTGVASLLLQKDTTKTAGFIRGLLNESAKEITYAEGKTAGLIDYGHALSIYNAYADYYNTQAEFPAYYTNLTPPADYSAETEGMVVTALWGSTTHENMAGLGKNYVDEDFTNTKLEIVKEYVKVPDLCFPSTGTGDYHIANITAFHGASNYVVHMKYLWFFAIFLGRQTEPTSYATMTSAISAARSSAKTKIADCQLLNADYGINESYCTTDTRTERAEVLINLMSSSGVILRVTSDGNGGYRVLSKANNEYHSRSRMKHMVLGYLIHLAGDIYAHRTIIPNTISYSDLNTTSVSTKKSSANNNVIDTDDVQSSKLAALKQGISNFDADTGWIKFVDLWQYLQGRTLIKDNGTEKEYTNKELANTFYIDNPSFCPNRYSDACDNIKLIFAKEDDSSFVYYKFIHPGRNKVKLFNFKVYVREAGYDPDNHTPAINWASCST